MQYVYAAIAGESFEAEKPETDFELRDILKRASDASSVSLDLETTGYTGQKDYGPDKGEIRLAQLGWYSEGEINAAVIDAQEVDLSALVPFLESQTPKVIHYSPFERAWIGHHLGCQIANVIDTCYLGQSINKKLRGDVAQEALGGAIITETSREDYGDLQRQLFKLADTYTLPSGREVTLLEVKAAYDKAQIPLEGWKLSERATLAAMTSRYLGIELDKEGQTSDWSGELTYDQIKYAIGDAVATIKLRGPVSRIARQLDVYDNMLRRVNRDMEGGE